VGRALHAEGHAAGRGQGAARCRAPVRAGSRVPVGHGEGADAIAYQDADEFKAWWDKDAQTLAEVVKRIGKVEDK